MRSLEPLVDLRALRDQVYEQVLEMLLSGAVKPDERLPIDALSRQLNVSPTPVREALVQLEQTGLVRREARKGYRAAPPLDSEHLEKLFDARLALEVAAAEAAAQQPAKAVASLRRALSLHTRASQRVIDEYQRTGTVRLAVTQAYFQSDATFHEVVFEYSQNPYLQEMYSQLDALTHRMRQAAARGPGDVREAMAEHSRILAAFEAGRSEEIVASMRDHILAVRGRAVHDSAPTDE